MCKLLGLIALGLVTACSNPNTHDTAAFGQWGLVDAGSNVSFVSVKKETVAETHDFNGGPALVGFVDSDGQAKVQIVLDALESHIDIRNTRMREHLFETNKHPFAVLTTNIDVTTYQNLAIGSGFEKALDVSIDLHGRKLVKSMRMKIDRPDENTVMVTNLIPVSIHASDFGMAGGTLKLKELAKLSSISPRVDVNFTLRFER